MTEQDAMRAAMADVFARIRRDARKILRDSGNDPGDDDLREIAARAKLDPYVRGQIEQIFERIDQGERAWGLRPPETELERTIDRVPSETDGKGRSGRSQSRRLGDEDLAAELDAIGARLPSTRLGPSLLKGGANPYGEWSEDDEPLPCSDPWKRPVPEGIGDEPSVRDGLEP